jgi:PleD family two-component response regulator
MTVSIGIAQYVPSSDPAEDLTQAAEQLIAEADQALYEAKAAGRNQVAVAVAARVSGGALDGGRKISKLRV